MKKVYKYRNISFIKGKVSLSLLGFYFKDYPEINDIAKKYNLDKEERGTKWAFYERFLTHMFEISTSYKTNTIVFNPIYETSYNHLSCNKVGFYYNVKSGQLVTKDDLHMEEILTYCVPVTFKPVQFHLSLENLSKIEIKSKWYLSDIFLKMEFNTKVIAGRDTFRIAFSKEQKEDLDFFIDDINSIRKKIESNHHEKFMKSMMDNNDEL